MKKNIENIQKALTLIEQNPACWNQTQWHCGTSHCFFGHGQILAGKEPNNDTARRDGRIFFGFTKEETDYYSCSYRTLNELKTALEDFYNADGYNRYGYDRYGYDRYGYDLDGYDLDGYNRNGYNRYGYDRYGYDRDGYDSYGFDRDNNYKS
jgi:hypothetical protein